MECPNCGYIFPPSEEEKLTRAPSITPVLSTEKPWFPVTLRTFRHHPGKPDGRGGFKPDSVKCTMMIGLKAVNQWLCPEHQGYPKTLADRWWAQHSGSRPFPATVIEWLERQGELRDTAEVQLSYAGNPKYPEVVGLRVGERTATAANDNQPKGANDNSMVDLDDIIPF